MELRGGEQGNDTQAGGSPWLTASQISLLPSPPHLALHEVGKQQLKEKAGPLGAILFSTGKCFQGEQPAGQSTIIRKGQQKPSCKAGAGSKAGSEFLPWALRDASRQGITHLWYRKSPAAAARGRLEAYTSGKTRSQSVSVSTPSVFLQEPGFIRCASCQRTTTSLATALVAPPPSPYSLEDECEEFDSFHCHLRLPVQHHGHHPLLHERETLLSCSSRSSQLCNCPQQSTMPTESTSEVSRAFARDWQQDAGITLCSVLSKGSGELL